MAGSDAAVAWVVMLEQRRRRWGGDLRRGQIFRRLAERTGAPVVGDWSATALRRHLGIGWFAALRRRSAWPRPRLASGEMLPPDVLRGVERLADPAAVAVYDDPIAQTAALGIRLPAGRERALRRRRVANLGAFRWHVTPTESFARLVGLDLERVIVGGNGTDVRHIRPAPWPERPGVGMVSGAAPGRGIELLVDATRRLRADQPELRLLLWLVATGAASRAYLRDLRRRLRRERWIAIDTVAYDRLGDALGMASVLCIPHPPNEYMDAALPVKLFDSLAAGRPVVVTPRAETAAVITRHGAGVVAAGDRAEDLAASIAGLLADEGHAQRMGQAARDAAEGHYDWTVVGDRIASELLTREGWPG